MSSPIKEQIKYRSRLTIYLMAAIAVLILLKIIYLQSTQKIKLLAKVKEFEKKERVIQATRGNIYAADGRSLLATSIPQYKVIINPSQSKKVLFENSLDSLALKLADFFGDKSYLEYKEIIYRGRKNGSKYIVLGNRKIEHLEKITIEKFPLFKEGVYKGGGSFDMEEYRFLPFNNLASRTIGKLDPKNKREGHFGLEASFENYLRGRDGKGFYEYLAGGNYKPKDLDSDIDAEAGLDIYTTLDVNFQDIVESSLRNQVTKMQAKYGSAVIMEVATGEIKAIANLSRHVSSSGEIQYYEDKNYAVAEGTDPGSTFKLATMAALIEKAKLNLNEFGVDCSGELIHNGLSFTCSHEHGTLTIQQIFEQSCNVGVYSLMKKHFGFKSTSDYFEYLQRFNLDKPSGFQLKGEPLPVLKNSKSSTFSGTTIPWMSIGYESRITPIQMLTFYNAIANDGYWVQPIIVKETRNGLKTIDKFYANKIETAIASEETIKKTQKMMEGVVLNGTAKNVSQGHCQIAGKTGTSQKRVGGHYRAGSYYTSFIGYFPANNPKYSCIVVIDEPQGANIYAADVSAPVFRSIADKIYAYDVAMHPQTPAKANLQKLGASRFLGRKEDHKALNEGLGLKYYPAGEGFFTNESYKKDSIKWVPLDTEKNGLNAMIGMSLKDALPLLENKGYRVKYTGMGKVRDYNLEGKSTVKLVLN